MIFSDKKELLKLYNAVANKKLFKETFHITPAMLRKRTNWYPHKHKKFKNKMLGRRILIVRHPNVLFLNWNILLYGI